MSDWADKDPIVRLFASVDLIGSTSYKNKFSDNPKSYTGGKPPWFKEIGDFYNVFAKKLREAEEALPDESSDRSWEIVKAIGDELLLTCIVENQQAVYRLSLVFRNGLRLFNRIGERKLKVKGCLWLAGFPINNAVAPIASEKHQKSLDDYLGPSIDAGFRIAKLATLRKLSVSVDLALLLTHPTDKNELKFYYDGNESLKGVLSEKPYPMIWIESDEDTTEEDLLGIRKAHCELEKLHEFCRNFIESVQESSWLVIPYFKQDSSYSKTASWHKRIREELDASVKETLGEDDFQEDGSATFNLRPESFRL